MEEKNVYVVTVAGMDDSVARGEDVLKEELDVKLRKKCIAGIFDEEHKENAETLINRVKSAGIDPEYVEAIPVVINKDLMKVDEESENVSYNNGEVSITISEAMAMRPIGLALWFEDPENEDDPEENSEEE